MSYPSSMSEERMKALYESFTKGGRPLAELKAGTDSLSGADGQVLRSSFASYGLHPADCDDFELVGALMTANEGTIQRRFGEEVKLGGGGAEGRKKAVEKWESYRDSPNRLPVIDILQVGAFTKLVSTGSIPERYFSALTWMMGQSISVEGRDVAGYTALQHSLSATTQKYDFRWSTILLEASKDPILAINNRNRFGATAAHECCMSYRRPGEDEIRSTVLTWLLDHGANVDIPDNDGATARRTAAKSPTLLGLIRDRDEALARDGGCIFCRRGGVTGKGKGKDEENSSGELRATLRCGRCHVRTYCSPVCQKLDWRAHKANCVPSIKATKTETGNLPN